MPALPPAGGSFTLALPARISFGAGTAKELPRAVAELGAGHAPRVLLVTGGTPGRFAGLIAALAAQVSRLETTSISGEPTIADARRAAEAGRAAGAEVVVGIGGGSVIDLAKAAAMLVANGGDPLDYLEVIGSGQPIGRPALPVVAVPTTAGTGSEVTANAVLASSEHGLKASLRHPGMIPKHSIVDPELTFGCPPEVTAASGMDALTQCLEPYVSNRANPVSDGWAATGLQAAGRSLRAAHALASSQQPGGPGGEDDALRAARTDMSLASMLGGLALANAKLGAVHGFAGVIGGMTDAPHGAICAALLAPVCRANLAQMPPDRAGRFADVAIWLTGDSAASATDGLDWIEQTNADLGIPGLATFGLTPADAAAVAAKTARASSTQGNPVTLDPETLAGIFLAAL